MPAAAAAMGLTEAEAKARLAADGPNELPAAHARSWFRIALGVLREPMFGLLLGAGAIYLLLGDFNEALVLLGFATLSVSIAVVQETRSEHVLEALRDLSSPRALVVREGRERRIAGREVVRGDLIRIAEGDRVPADATLMAGNNVSVDESLLTGESVPVRKTVAVAGAPAAAAPGGDDLPYIYSGTLVVGGNGKALVTATGANSEIGKIGSALRDIEATVPRLQRQTRRLVAIFAAIGAALSIVAVLLYGLMRGSWLDALLGGIALGMSMLPEEIPLVLTVFMVTGAWRISRAGVLTRKAAAIETLGAATVLCTDKTGTLTQNRMSIAYLETPAERWRAPSAFDAPPPESFAEAIETGFLASAREPYDPMDRAFHDAAVRSGAAAAHGGDTLLKGYELSAELLAMTNVWRSADGRRVVAAKGAPEAIFGLCRLDEAAMAALRARVDAVAADGMRVLALARAVAADGDPPASPRDFPFAFVGLVGFADPLRPTVPSAVRECLSAGIRVVMITGDHPATARAIAAEASIVPGDILTGDDLRRMDDGALAARVCGTTVFARIRPEQKLRIVKALQANGEVVAMTGDGVNDAPALKAADIGIAMGSRGTDVAREASSIVLLDDDFGSIVATIRLGRRIYDNLRKAMSYILAVHVPIAGLAILPLLLGWPLVLTPMLIALLEMVIDPVCSVVLEAEPEEKDIMERPPRLPGELLLSPRLLGWSLAQGALAFVATAGVYLLGMAEGIAENEVRALAFVALVMTNLGLIMANRSFGHSLVAALMRRNPTLWWSLGATTLVIATILIWPVPRDLFRLGPLHADGLLACFAVGALLLVVLEAVKRALGERLKH
jgi:Ca2+-transporting ATPase